jgi:hypothetical protein
MARRNPNLSWIKTVLADRASDSGEPHLMIVVDNGDTPPARLVPDSATSPDAMPDLDTDWVEGAIED